MIANIILIAKIVGLKKEEKQLNGTSQAQSSSNNSEEETPEVPLEEELKQMSESKRMKRYVGIFFENIENGNYEDAFKVLNSDFKKNYFNDNLNEFKDYANKYFNPSTMVVTYDNVERLGNNKSGNMYVLWLTIGNLFQPKLAEDQEIEQTNFVIIEYNYNDYEMSFSVQGVEEV